MHLRKRARRSAAREFVNQAPDGCGLDQEGPNELPWAVGRGTAAGAAVASAFSAIVLLGNAGHFAQFRSVEGTSVATVVATYFAVLPAVGAAIGAMSRWIKTEGVAQAIAIGPCSLFFFSFAMTMYPPREWFPKEALIALGLGAFVGWRVGEKAFEYFQPSGDAPSDGAIE